MTVPATVIALTVLPTPSCPYWPLPQQRPVPSDIRAHVCSLPALTRSPVSGTVGRVVVVVVVVVPPSAGRCDGSPVAGAGVGAAFVGVGPVPAGLCCRLTVDVRDVASFLPVPFSSRTRTSTESLVPLTVPRNVNVRVAFDRFTLAIAITR